MDSLSTLLSVKSQLTTLGLAQGQAVFVHASMKAIGPMVGGARVIVEALLDQVGSEGLVAMPGFSTDAYWPEDIDATALSATEAGRVELAVPGFDVAKSPTSGMGVIAETFRTWPGTVRSTHPSTSVCLNGLDAEKLVARHSLDWAMGPETPFGALYHRPNSKILLMGVGWNRCTALHTAETFAETRRTKTRRFKTGRLDSPWAETQDVADDLGRLFPAVGAALEATGRVTNGKLGHADCKFADFKDLVDFASEWINQANLESGERH